MSAVHNGDVRLFILANDARPIAFQHRHLGFRGSFRPGCGSPTCSVRLTLAILPITPLVTLVEFLHETALPLEQLLLFSFVYRSFASSFSTFVRE